VACKPGKILYPVHLITATETRLAGCKIVENVQFCSVNTVLTYSATGELVAVFRCTVLYLRVHFVLDCSSKADKHDSPESKPGLSSVSHASMNVKFSQPRMAVQTLALLVWTAWIGIWARPVAAQTPDATAEYKKARDEFVQAEQSAQKRQVSTESFQRELDKLVEQKAHWESESVFANGKVAYANEKLKHYTTLGNQEEIEKWRIQAENWTARSKAAELELAKVESDIQATVQALQTSFKQSDEGSLLLPGETIEVFVAEDDTLNGPCQIRRGGYIILPRVGRVTLAGKNVTEAEKAIKEALGLSQIKDATVMVERSQGVVMGEGAVIYLAGEFVKPGAWKIPQGISPTIVTTILRSGGLTDSADLTKVRLLRLVNGQALVEEVNVRAILDGVGLRPDLTLNSGDIVMVPPFANVVYVTGNVLKPSTIKLLPNEELTAHSAILRAGGFARFANRKKVYVLRDQGNGMKKKITINIKDLQANGGKDVVLQSKDVVVVPEKFFSF
jgi:protein involved in polysaccharide export with SLBB domain